MNSVFCLIFLLFLKYSSSMEINSVFEKSDIVPDILDEAPNEVLHVTYNNKNVQLGNELTPTDVKDQPEVRWTAEKNSYYTLLMVDPDAPSRAEPKLREVKHWFVGNILGNDVSSGDHITAYFGSGPPKGTGLHRYIFLLYKQKDLIYYQDEPRTSNISREHRFNFCTRTFIEKYNLGDPVAGNFFVAQWDKYVDERNKKIQELLAQGRH